MRLVNGRVTRIIRNSFFIMPTGDDVALQGAKNKSQGKSKRFNKFFTFTY